MHFFFWISIKVFSSNEREIAADKQGPVVLNFGYEMVGLEGTCLEIKWYVLCIVENSTTIQSKQQHVYTATVLVMFVEKTYLWIYTIIYSKLFHSLSLSKKTLKLKFFVHCYFYTNK